MPNHHPSELNSILSDEVATLRRERHELLDLLKDCHSVIDSIMAKVISLDSGFRPTQTWYWRTMERLSETLRKNKRL